MALPSVLTYGRATGRFILAVADSVDPDTQPDAVAAEGTVKFVPSVSHVVVASADPDPVFISPQAIECTLDVDGYLVGPNGARGISLVAANNDAMTPKNWTYMVQFNIKGLNIQPFSISVTAGSEQDLALTAPVPTSGGTTVLVSVQTKIDAEMARDQALDALATIQMYAPVIFLPEGEPIPTGAPDPALIARYSMME